MSERNAYPYGQPTRILGDPTVRLVYGVTDEDGKYIIRPGTVCRLATLFFHDNGLDIEVYHQETGEIVSVNSYWHGGGFGELHPAWEFGGKLDDGKRWTAFPSIVASEVYQELQQRLGRYPDPWELQEAVAARLGRAD